MAPVDSGGNASRPSSPIPVDGQTAQAPEVNVPVNDIYSILNMLMFLDGRKSLQGNIPMNGYRASNAGDAVNGQDYVTLAQMNAAIAAVTQLYPGFMVPDTVTSTAAPAGWLYANGAEVTRAAYPTLWARVSAGNNLAATQGAKTHGQYGPGNGTTTFTLPNLYADNGYFIRPLASGRTIGSVQADELKSHGHTLTMDAVPPHSHPYTTQVPSGGGAQYGQGFIGVLDQTRTTSPGGGHTPTGSIGATGGTETRPQNIAYPVLIKT
jgi:microcystin-dependent protein